MTPREKILRKTLSDISNCHEDVQEPVSHDDQAEHGRQGGLNDMAKWAREALAEADAVEDGPSEEEMEVLKRKVKELQGILRKYRLGQW